MGIKLITRGPYKDKKRFVVETENEGDILEDARNFFGDAYTFFTEGLGHKIRRKSASGYFYHMRVRKDGHGDSIPLEDWEKIQYYAIMYYNGERYDPETFARPVIQIP